MIYEVGDETQVLYVIQAGQVELQRDGASGSRTVARHGPGDFFGEMGVLAQPPPERAGRGRERRPAPRARPHHLRGHVRSSAPRSRLRMIRRLVTRVTDLEQRLAALGADDLLRPVVRVLVRRAEPGPRQAAPTSRRTFAQLAGESGSRMLEAHRALGQLLERKRVRLQDDALVIPDLEALSAALD